LLSAPPPAGPGVILISLDTVRRDRVGAFGSGRGLTPTLDALAGESVRFTRAYSPQPFTLTAHMTMLTGLSPSVHALAPESSLPDTVTTLAESFREAGWVTAALVDTVTWLHPRYGFDRGFSVYRQVEGDASSKDEQVRLLLEDVGDRPMFLFVHVYDAHSDESVLPYEADAPHLERLAGWYEGDFTGCLPDRGCASRLLLELNRLGEPLTGDDRRYLSSLYDAGLASLDDRLAAIFQRLERSGVLDRSVLVVTADHGEEFFEHGRALHDQSYEESVRVPLLVRMPGGEVVGTRHDLVGLTDLAPTVRALAGLPDVPGQGISFAGALRDAPISTTRDAVLLDSGRGSLGIITERWKLFPTREGFELYDLAEDPEERFDLIAAGSQPDVLPALRARLDAMRQAVRSHRLSLGLPEDPAARRSTSIESPLSEDALRQLEALGYTR
jgi:arylsulfatase A-like enzyme